MAVRLTVKGSQITSGQMQVAQTLLGVGKGLNAPAPAMVAIIYAGMGESSLGADANTYQPNGASTSQSSKGYWGVLQAAVSEWPDPHDTVGMAHAFFTGRGPQGQNDFQTGGINWVRQGVTNPAEIAIRTENPSTWPSDAYATQWPGGESQGVSEAQAIATSLAGVTPITSTSGTTTSPNQTSASPWTVGNSSNPDQDYWTTINQYCQQAQWYCASDGERLIIADGIQLMGQTPRAVISRYDPAVLEMDATYDNSAFSYTTKHIKKGGLASPAALTKVTSPTSVTIKLICDIDAFQAMDTVGLADCGPANGAWLIGQTRRSVFQPYTELTLVQGMQPLNALTGTPFSGTPGAVPTAPGSSTIGAYVNPFAKASGLVVGRIDDGVDFSMAIGSPILAIGNCKVTGIRPWGGAAGQQPIMTMQFLDGPKQGAYWYIAEQITPSVGQGALVSVGAELCKYAPSGSAIETGYSNDPITAQTLAQANGHGGQVPSPEGASFATLLQSLGVKIFSSLGGFP